MASSSQLFFQLLSQKNVVSSLMALFFINITWNPSVNLVHSAFKMQIISDAASHSS